MKWLIYVASALLLLVGCTDGEYKKPDLDTSRQGASLEENEKGYSAQPSLHDSKQEGSHNTEDNNLKWSIPDNEQANLQNNRDELPDLVCGKDPFEYNPREDVYTLNIENCGEADAKDVEWEIIFADKKSEKVKKIKEDIDRLDAGEKLFCFYKNPFGNQGTRGVTIRIDPYNKIEESDEENNSFEKTIGLPDLTCTKPGFLSNSNTSYSVDIKNIGDRPAKDVDVLLTVEYMDFEGKKKKEEKRTHINCLRPGETGIVFEKTEIIDKGFYTVRINVDPDNKIKELDEENNNSEEEFVQN